MSVLAQAFEKTKTSERRNVKTAAEVKNAALPDEASFLGHIFSSPFFRGSYKEEKPEIDIKLKGSKNERKRLTALINTIVQNSPTGKRLLQDAAGNGYSLDFLVQSNSFGSCDRERKRVHLNPTFDDNKLIATLAHETRHAQQHQRGVPVLVDFFAEWCSPCRQLTPVLEEVSNELNGKLKVVKMNIDDSPETPTNFGVRGIPTLIMFKNGAAVATHTGAMTKSKLTAWLNEQLG